MSGFSAKFRTKDQRISIPDDVYQLDGSFGPRELFSIVKKVVSEPSCELLEDGNLSFLINGKLLRTKLKEHFELEQEEQLERPLDLEKVLEIEYFISQISPKPLNSFSSDDWISCVHVNQTVIINGCYDGKINIWSLDDCQHLLGIKAHSSAIKDVQWIPSESMKPIFGDTIHKNDQFFASCSYDETCCIWRWNPIKSRTEDSVERLYVCKGHKRSVDCVDIMDDLLATGSYDRMLKIWSLSDQSKDIKSNRNERKNESGDENEFSDDGKKAKKPKHDDSETVESSADKSDTFECMTKTPVMTLSEHTEAITDLTWIRKGNKKNFGNSPIAVATCSMDNTIKIWDVELGKVIQTLIGSKAFLTIDHSPLNGLMISGSCDRHLRLWDPRSNEGSMVKAAFESHKGWVSCVQWCSKRDNLFVSGSYDGLVKQWDTRCTRSPLYDLLGHEDKVLAVDWSNYHYIVSGSADKNLKVYNQDFPEKL
ncbi:ribosome biogenesis protein WDR12 homolog [Brevipalpus obovatus]|uniref:ribosome biogenesis protein WDR12 homolog n=1 Tax=Brevipalpus obovatus TaxID=246614 RepID=UPI003D9EEF40